MTDRDPAVADVLERTRPRATEGADWDDVARRTAAAPRPAPRRPLVRALRWAPGLAGGVAIAAVLGVMVVRSGDAPPSAAPTGVTGVEALVRVTSIREGQTDEQAAERMETMLTERARIQGITGFRTERSGAALSIFVPRTHDARWIRGWLPLAPQPVVYDLNRSVVARSGNPMVVAEAVEVPEPATAPVAYYLVVRRERTDSSSVNGPFATRDEALRDRGRLVAGALAARVVAVPADTTLSNVFVARLGGHPRGGFVFMALRGPIVRSGEIRDVRARGNAVTLGVEPAARERAGLALRSARPVLVAWGVLDLRYEGFTASTGELVFRDTRTLRAAQIAYGAAGGGADALATIERSRPVGPAPERPGTQVPGLAAQLRARFGGTAAGPGLDVQAPTVRRVVSTRGPEGTWSVWSALSADGQEVAGEIGPGGPSGAGSCAVNPARSLLSVCFRGGGPIGTRLMLGRADTRVASVTAVSEDGTRTEGRAANGFFLVLPPTKPGEIRALVARDRTGREIGRLTWDDPVYGTMLGGLR